MDELRIGIIGIGRIGEIHCKVLTDFVAAARVVAISDPDEPRARKNADYCGARYEPDAQALIEAPDVDAVIVASWDPTHEQYVKACIEAGKYVFCEKPLSDTAEGCRRIMEAEEAGGKRLLQVGYMRRFDDSYRQLKAVLDGGSMGRVLMMHCYHRNPQPGGAKHTTETLITRALSHEFDITRWLLGEDYSDAQVVYGRSSKYAEEGLQDPQLVILHTQSGIAVAMEIGMHDRYGYEVACEALCDEGSVRLASPSAPQIRRDLAVSEAVTPGWQERFHHAYEVELSEWVDAVRAGNIVGPSAWDGYQSQTVADVCVEAGRTRRILPVEVGECPAFYR